MSNEDKMREEFRRLHPNSELQDQFAEGWKACAAIKDAEIAALKTDQEATISSWMATVARVQDERNSAYIQLSKSEAEIAEARKTAEYWKAEHLAGNKEIAARDLMIKELREALRSIIDPNSNHPYLLTKSIERAYEDIAYDALEKAEHHNSRALDKMLLEAELKGIMLNEQRLARTQDIEAKLAELNKE